MFPFAVLTHKRAIRMDAVQDSDACGQGSVWAVMGILDGQGI